MSGFSLRSLSMEAKTREIIVIRFVIFILASFISDRNGENRSIRFEWKRKLVYRGYTIRVMVIDIYLGRRSSEKIEIVKSCVNRVNW